MASHRKGATGRNYAAEYAARKARGTARGLSTAQIRGHARPSEARLARTRAESLAAKYQAVAGIRSGQTRTAAAASAGVAPSTLRRFIQDRGITPQALAGGGDHAPVLAVTGYFPVVYVDKPTMSLLSVYWREVWGAFDTGQTPYLEPYEHTVVYSLDGHRLLLETDVEAVRAWRASVPDTRAFWNLFQSDRVVANAA